MKRLLAIFFALMMLSGCVTAGVTMKYGNYSGAIQVGEEGADCNLGDAEKEFGIKIEY